MANKIELILFDQDGILIDAQQIHRDALRKALKVEGVKVDYRDEDLEGLPTYVKLNRLGVYGDEALRVNLRKQNYTLEAADKYPVDLYRQGLLRRLVVMDYQVACVTNSIPQTAERFLVSAGLFGDLDFLITNRHVINPKPDPECYTYAMTMARKRPEETLIVEDSAVGIAAARGSGAHVLETDFKSLNYFSIAKAIQRAELA